MDFINEYIPESLIAENLTYIYEKYKIIYKTGKNYKNDCFDHATSLAPNFDLEYDIENCINLNLSNYEGISSNFYKSLKTIDKKFFRAGSV